MEKNSISSFSVCHEWSLYWKKDGNPQSSRIIYCESQKEQALLKALASVDVIGRKSLLEIFDINKQRAKRMCFEGKLVEHKIHMAKRQLCIYTLGKVGAELIDVAGYKANYWLQLEVADVLKRLVYYHLYSYLPDMQIGPAVKPFVGSLTNGENQLFVYVLRGNCNDLLQFLKWDENFSERLIIVTESLSHVEPAIPFLLASKTNVRIAEDLDLDLYTDEPIQSSFYFIDTDTKQLIRDQVINSDT